MFSLQNPCLGRQRLFSHLLATKAFAALLLGLLTLFSPAIQAARLALVVGNDGYQNVERLKNAGNDAKLIATTLRKAGFEVSEHQNLDRNRLYDAVDGFQKRLGKGDEVVFYFSGHGVQLDNDPMLLPIDIQANDDKKLRREALPLLYVQDALKDARVSLLVIDACRDNPFPKQGTRTIGETRGLRPPDVVKGQAVILSAGRNQKALDSVPGEPGARNGLFTHEFARVIATPGLDVRSALNTIRDQVEDKAAKVNHTQRPSLIDDLRGQFVLMASVGVVPTGQPVQATQTDPEQEAWELAKRRDTVAGYEGFLASFPNGRLAASARSALAGLKPTQPAVQNTQASQNSNASTSAALTTPGQVFRDCQEAHCPEMVVIPAGNFTMGSNERDDEKLPHSVNVRSFALGKYAVTKGQFAAFVNAKGYRTEAEQGDGCYGWSGSTWEKSTRYNWRNVGFAQTDDHPVVCVSWNDAQAYVQWLSQSTGKAYRLPSEAEREYAARAGTTSKYWWGDTASHEYANYGKDQCCGPLAQGRDQWEYTSPVGQFPANGFGLHDMHGNTWDWVQDVWHDNYNSAPTDGSSWSTEGGQSRRVLRGGSWFSNPNNLRSANRIRITPDNRFDYDGFRLARTVP